MFTNACGAVVTGCGSSAVGGEDVDEPGLQVNVTEARRVCQKSHGLRQHAPVRGPSTLSSASNNPSSVLHPLILPVARDESDRYLVAQVLGAFANRKHIFALGHAPPTVFPVGQQAGIDVDAD